MRVCHFETTVSGDGTVTVKDIPFPPGEAVEVVVSARDLHREGNGTYPLRGKPIQYVDPFESVAEDHWEVIEPDYCRHRQSSRMFPGNAGQ